MNELTRDELDAIKARLDCAKDEPWQMECGDSNTWHWEIFATDTAEEIAYCYSANDGFFIAHAPTDVARLVVEVERLQAENATLKKQAVEPWNNRLPEKPGEYRIINTKTGEQQNTVFFWENSILRNKLLCIVKDVWAGTSKHFSASELLEQGYFFSYLPMSFADESYPNHPTAHSEQLTSETVVAAMRTWTDEQRMDVLREFCRHCGDTDPYCQCWNNE